MKSKIGRKIMQRSKTGNGFGDGFLDDPSLPAYEICRSEQKIAGYMALAVLAAVIYACFTVAH